MTTLFPKAVYYTSKSHRRYESGIIEWRTPVVIPTRYIETKDMDVSMFPAVRILPPTKFTLVAYFLYHSPVILWEATTNHVDLAFTLAKGVFDLGQIKDLMLITLSADRIDHYFLLWGGYMTISLDRRAELQPVIANPIIPYTLLDLPLTLPGVVIENRITSGTGNLIWSIESTPELEIIHPTRLSTYLVLTSAVRYQGPVTIRATNPSGLVAETTFQLSIGNIPIILDPGLLTASTSNPVPFEYTFSNLSIAAGEEIWSFVSPPTANMHLQSSNGLLTVYPNQYVNENIHVQVDSFIEVLDDIIVPVHIAETPVLAAVPPISFSFETTSNLFPLHQTAIGTGPLTYSMELATTGSNAIRIDSNTGELQIQDRVYYNDSVTFYAANPVGGSNAQTTHLHITPVPQFPVIPPLHQTSRSGVDYFISLSNTPLEMPLTWYISPTSNMISSNIGAISVRSNAFVQERIHVFASNALGGCNETYFDIMIAQEPAFIYSDSDTLRATLRIDPYVSSTLQNAIGTGPLFWNVTAPSNLDRIFIDPTAGQLLVPFDLPVDPPTPVTITASNAIGDTYSSTFALHVTQTPIPRPPVGGILRMSRPYDEPSAYPILLNTASTHIADVTWSVTTTPNTPGSNFVSVDTIGGILRIPANHYVNTTVTVAASNQYQEFADITFPLIVAETPDFSCNAVRTTLTSNIAFQYTPAHHAEFTGPLVWSYAPPIPNLTLNMWSGMFTYDSYESLETMIVVYATNPTNTTTAGAIELQFLRTPTIQNPITHYQSVSASTATSNYQLQQVPQHSLCNVTWSLDTPVAGVTLEEPQQGILRFDPNIPIDTNITVSMSNALGAFDQQTFHLITAETPTLGPLPTITSNLPPMGILQIPLTQLEDATCNLQWTVSPPYYGFEFKNTSSNGAVLVFHSNLAVNEPITVRATNRAFGCNETTAHIHLTRTPVLETPPAMIASVPPGIVDYTYPITQTTLGTGPLTWYFLHSNLPGVSLDLDGTLRVANNTYVPLSNLTVATSNQLGYSCNVTFDIHIADKPVFQLPLHIRSVLTPPYIYQYEIPFLNAETAAGPLVWEVQAIDSNITVDPTGILFYTGSNFINETIRITASNELMDFYTAQVPITIGGTPVITHSGTVTSNISANQPMIFEYPITYTAVETGPLDWQVTDPFNNPIAGLTINSDGVLCNVYYSIDAPVKVRASALNDTSSSVQFTLQVAQTPSILDPGPIVFSIPPSSNFSYAMELQNSIASTGPLTWSMNSNISGFSIDPSSGIITATSNTYVEATVQIMATNFLGYSDAVQIPFTIRQLPTIYNPITVHASRLPSQTFTYPFQLESVLGEGEIVTWQAGSNTSFEPIYGLSIDTQTGVMTLASNIQYRFPLYVKITNDLGGSAMITCSLHVLNRPILPYIPELKQSRPYNTDFNYGISNYAVPETSIGLPPIPLQWTVTNYAGLTFTATDYAVNLRLAAGNFLRSRPVTISAMNGLNAGSNTTFLMSIEDIPVIYTPTESLRRISRNADDTYKFTMFLQPTGRGSTWSLSNAPIGASINATTGELTFQPNISFVDTLTVVATNYVLDKSSNEFSIEIVTVPQIGAHPCNIEAPLIPGNDFTFQYSNINIGTGPLAWKVQPTIPGLSIESNTGQIRFAYSNSIDEPITVIASNILGGHAYDSSVTMLRCYPPPVISDFTATVTNSNAIQTNWSNVAYVSSATLSNLSNSQAYSITPPMSSFLISDLNPNQLYQFQMIPSNPLQINGDAVYTSIVRTRPAAITNITIPFISYDQLTLNWAEYIGSNVNIYDASNVNTFIQYVSSPSISTTISGLTPNQTYQYLLTSSNNNGDPAMYSTISPAVVTLPRLDTTNIDQIVNNQCRISWTGVYHRVRIQLNTNIITVDPGLTQYVYTGLAENTQYQFTVIPYNRLDVAGGSLTTSTIRTLASIGPLNTSYTNNTIYIYWGPGSYTTVSVTWTGTSSGSQTNITGPSASIVLLEPVATYVFVATPYNVNGVAGTSRSVSVSIQNGVIVIY